MTLAIWMSSVVFIKHEQKVKREDAEFNHFGGQSLGTTIMFHAEGGKSKHARDPTFKEHDSLPSNLVMIVEGDCNLLKQHTTRVSSASTPTGSAANISLSYRVPCPLCLISWL